ncbi:DUF4007 family protein [Thiohalocapsa sp. ML1]|uniref:DUF4007 family protein n=1 Tax=Thiohalocapsa sp. ML1 TaxID=1431688 RepID=UPI0007323DFE|nr:DUF4007 family protein [Thiohalocapsa sp. ML1]
MRFDFERTAFGRHETFALRFGWLTKGAQALIGGEPVFEAEDATVRLGVGKNMVSSIRYWLQAARLIERSEMGWTLTDIGAYVFDDDGCDPYLEDEATIWLLHWLIASNPALATSWWWFFNRFHKPEFTGGELTTALQDFVKAQVQSRVSPSTLKSDSEVLRRMYVRSAPSGNLQIEEALDSPLTVLGLITELPEAHGYESRPAAREDLPPTILGFAVVELLRELGEMQLPVADLMYGPVGYPALGAVFRLTEGDLLAKLERLVAGMPHKLELRETAGVHQLYVLDDLTPIDMLDAHYNGTHQRAAA